MLEAIKSVNAALAFVLELGVLIALGYWGWTLEASMLARIGLGIALPLLAILVLLFARRGWMVSTAARS